MSSSPDILERLRADPTLNSALEQEAAREIERLRALVSPSAARPDDEMAAIRKAIREARDVGVLGISGRSWLMLVMAAEGYTVLAGRTREGGK